jgi:hypothetical protein
MKLTSFSRIVLIVIFFLLTIACDKIQEKYEARNDDQLAKTKYWSEQIPQIGVRCNLSTSWNEGKVYYIFTAYPLIQSTEENKSEDFNGKAFQSKRFFNKLEIGYGMPIFTVRLTDQSGFEIISIEMTGPIRIVDNDHKPIGLQKKSSIECSRKQYQNITGWELNWRE